MRHKLLRYIFLFSILKINWTTFFHYLLGFHSVSLCSTCSTLTKKFVQTRSTKCMWHFRWLVCLVHLAVSYYHFHLLHFQNDSNITEHLLFVGTQQKNHFHNTTLKCTHENWRDSTKLLHRKRISSSFDCICSLLLMPSSIFTRLHSTLQHIKDDENRRDWKYLNWWCGLELWFVCYVWQ